jgi:hypothetical protein
LRAAAADSVPHTSVNRLHLLLQQRRKPPMGDVIQFLRWQDIVDIFLVSFIIYRTILLIRGTRAVQMLIGIAVLIVIYFGARELELLTLYWLLRTLLSSIFLIIIIVFQRDIRRALTQVGKTPFYKTYDDALQNTIQVVVASARYLNRPARLYRVGPQGRRQPHHRAAGLPVPALVAPA